MFIDISHSIVLHEAHILLLYYFLDRQSFYVHNITSLLYVNFRWEKLPDMELGKLGAVTEKVYLSIGYFDFKK